MILHLSNSTGIIEKGLGQSVLVYPNPVDDELQIHSDIQIHSVTINGISGNCIQQLADVSDFNLLVNTSNLVPGVYLLKIETSKGFVIRKLIKSSNR
jgi:hypothetical protein